MATLRLFVMLLVACAAHVGWGQEIAIEPQRLSEHCWFFQGEAGMASLANKGFMSNAGFVVTSDGVVVFDALGTPALGRAMIAAIRKLTTQPIRRVVVSHYHADHIYGLQEFKSNGAEIWAHVKAKQYLTSGRQSSGWRSAGPIWRRGSTTKHAYCRPTSGSMATAISAWAA